MLDFGRHTLYIIAAYGVSALAIGVLIFLRRNRLKKAMDAEQAEEKQEQD